MNDIWTSLPGIRRDLVLLLGLVLAALVTVHAVMTKRDVASAIGWIGLAWFAPIMGSLSYFLFGVNRVRVRARTLHGWKQAPPDTPPPPEPGGHASHLAALERGIRRLTGHSTQPATRVDVLHNGDRAYPPMLAAIAAARHSVGLSSYIFRDDTWGGRFCDALAAAQARGVAVRVLIDGVGGGWLTSRTYRRLRRQGVPAARFLHSLLPWRMPFINLRSHKKILVVDGRVGFTGGMNIADENAMATRPKQPVQDIHFLIEGPVVGQLTEAFAQDWHAVTGEALAGADWFPPLDATGPGVPARVIDSGPDQNLEKIEFAIMQALACARDSVTVMTPYFLPDERVMTALSLAALRGVDVQVVIPARSNHRYLDHATRANIGPILRDGVRIACSPPPFRHAKLMVVDGAWCLIGSSNWDMRSLRLNFELCVELYDPALAQTLLAAMRDTGSIPLTRATLNRRSWPARFRDAVWRLTLPYI